MVSLTPSSSPEALADLIRQGIRENLIEPGTPLIQDDLARRFGVSRIPVREALRILAAERLVTIKQGGGATVTKLRSEEVTELYDLRLLIEPSLALPIVERVNGADINRLEKMTSVMDGVSSASSEGELALWARTNFNFHRNLYEIASHPHTTVILIGLLTRVQPYSLINVINLNAFDGARDGHADMLKALRTRDASQLADAMREHSNNARSHLLASYAIEPDLADPLGPLRGIVG